MTGVSFDNQPDLAALGKRQGVASREGQIDLHFDPAIHARTNHHVASFHGYQPSGKDVTGAQSYGIHDSQQNVAGANSHPQERAYLRSDQRRLQQNGSILLAAGHAGGHDLTKHGAAILVYGFHGGVKDVFKTRQLRHGFLEWSAQYLMRRALRDDVALV